jgi:hypothetical protein
VCLCVCHCVMCQCVLVGCELCVGAFGGVMSGERVEVKMGARRGGEEGVGS